MKCVYKVSDKLTVEVEAEGQKEIFAALAQVGEIFSESQCGQCKSKDIIFNVRKAKDKKNKEHTYYENKCTKCGAFLAFGQHLQGGTLFPKRKVEVDGKEVYDSQNRGWQKFQKHDEETD